MYLYEYQENICASWEWYCSTQTIAYRTTLSFGALAKVLGGGVIFTEWVAFKLVIATSISFRLKTSSKLGKNSSKAREKEKM